MQVDRKKLENVALISAFCIFALILIGAISGMIVYGPAAFPGQVTPYAPVWPAH